MDSALSITELKKSYGTTDVLKGISFEVARGETFALLGVNGAGKTTALECIEGVRAPYAGKIKLFGNDIAHSKAALKRTLGVQLQSTSLVESMTPKEAMQLFCAWHKTPYRQDLMTRFGMDEYLKKPYSALSTGRKRRLHLALALCHNPEILILDEPTAGLDVEGRHALHEEIRSLKKQGTTILMATHDMDEAETLCDRIALLKDGKIAIIGNPLELTAKASAKSRITIKTQRPPGKEFLAGGYKELEDGYITFATNEISGTLLMLLEHLKETQNEIIDLRVERAGLEELFLSVAGGA